MIESRAQLKASLHQLSSMVDSVEGLRLDAEAKGDAQLLPTLTASYLARARELIAEIREYVDAQPEQPARLRVPAQVR